MTPTPAPEYEAMARSRFMTIYCMTASCRGHKLTYAQLEGERRAGRPYVYSKALRRGVHLRLRALPSEGDR